jgi:hypothetical protein
MIHDLLFDQQFASGEPVPRGQDRENVILGCVLWADHAGKRVRFYISPDIIDGVLNGENAVHDHLNVELCVRERTRLEKACQRAFDIRPGHYVELQPQDFGGAPANAAAPV